MKTSKKSLRSQRELIEKKLKPWLKIRSEKPPQAGWIKAIRGALGINTRQLADFLGINQTNALRLEQREARGKATLELIEKAADVMGCKLVYAIVPKDQFSSLDEIVSRRADLLSDELVKNVHHTMKLEKQGTGLDMKSDKKKLSEELKQKMDSRIWDKLKGKNNGL